MTSPSPTTDSHDRRRHGVRRLATVSGWTFAVVAIIVSMVAVSALSLSVRVDGSSMEPTLHTGDKLLPDLLHRHRIGRFVLVEATPTGDDAPGVAIVKRVIALPGDDVMVEPGATVTVSVRPAGSHTWLRVDNPAWHGGSLRACCAVDGRSTAQTAPARVPAGQYWLAGDNWPVSQDSRAFGFVPVDQVRAPLTWRLWPLRVAGSLKSPGVRLVANR